MTVHLPDKDFDLSNLSRRQAVVFEHLCSRARSGIQREIDVCQYTIDLPNASPTVVSEHRSRLRECRREMDLVQALHHRMIRARTAPLTPDERQRLDAAREADPDLSADDAQRVIYDMPAVGAATESTLEKHLRLRRRRKHMEAA